MRRLLTNWELKLVSLLVAVALWTYTSGQVRVEREVPVAVSPAMVTGLPEGLQVADIHPSEFTVLLSVPTGKLAGLRGQDLRPRLALPAGRAEPGTIEFPLSSRMLGFDSDIRIVSTEPADVRAIVVRLSAIVQAVLPAEAPAVIGLPAGIAADLRLDRTQVEVRGPRERIDQAVAAGEVLRFAPVRLEGVDSDLSTLREERVALRPLDGQPALIEPMVATVTLRPARIATVTLNLPVALLLAPDASGRWRLDSPAPVAEVRLSGYEERIRALRAEDLTAWIDLRGLDLAPGKLEAAVVVSTPDGIQAEAGKLSVVLMAVPPPAPEAEAEPATP